MSKESVKISDVLKTEYTDFLKFCTESGKIFVYELTTVDYIAFRSTYGKSREEISQLRKTIENYKPLSKSDNKESSQQESADVNTVSLEKFQKTKDSEISGCDAEKISSIDKNESVVSERIEEDDNEYDFFENSTELYENEKSSVIVLSDERKQNEIKNDNNELNRYKKFFDNDTITLAETLNVNSENYRYDSIDLLKLSVRSSNALKRAGVLSVSDILNLSEINLRKLKNLGEKSANEIINKTYDFVSTRSLFDNGIEKVEKFCPSVSFIHAVEALLRDEEYDIDKLNSDELKRFDKIKESVSMLGVDICLVAYNYPHIATKLFSAFKDFGADYYLYLDILDKISEAVYSLPKILQNKKLIPALFAYKMTLNVNEQQMGDNDYNKIISVCDDNTTISNIPNVFKSNLSYTDISLYSVFLMRFLNWMSFDLSTLIQDFYKKIEELFNNRERDLTIIEGRLNGKTLNELGEELGVTRERVRQIEGKFYKSFFKLYSIQKYDFIMLVYLLRNGDNVLYYNEIEETLGAELTKILWAAVIRMGEGKKYFYSKENDALVVREDKLSFSKSELQAALKDALSKLPQFVDEDEFEGLLAQVVETSICPAEIIENEVKKKYKKDGRFYHRGRISVVSMCEFVLKKYYPSGYKIADSFESEVFKKYLKECFGKNGASLSSRAIDAKIGDIGCLCDRGKYVHPDYVLVDEKVITAINEYIERSKWRAISFNEVYSALKQTFAGTWITNRYALHGALKKYGCPYHTNRDLIMKTEGISINDEFERFVEERGIVHKSEIFAAFPFMNDGYLGNISSRAINVYNIDNGYYIHANEFNVTTEDIESLRNYLNIVCADHPVDIRKAYDDVMVRFPDFCARNELDEKKLFAILNYMLSEEFTFSKPYIAKIGTTGISKKAVLLSYLSDYESIDIYTLVEICETNHINHISLTYILKLIMPEFIRIDDITVMRKDIANIDDEIINKTVRYIKELLIAKEYIVLSKFNDFLWLPETELDWNQFLLESIVNLDGELNFVFLNSDPYSVSNTVVVSEKYKNDTAQSLVLKILVEKVNNGDFNTKSEMREWLKDEGLIESKLPSFLEGTKYFYIDEKGVHCTKEDE